MSPDTWQAMQGGGGFGGFGGAIPSESLYGIEAGVEGAAGQTAGSAGLGGYAGPAFAALMTALQAAQGNAPGAMQSAIPGIGAAAAMMAGMAPMAASGVAAPLALLPLLYGLFGGSESSSIGRERNKDISSSQQAHEAMRSSMFQQLQDASPQLQTQGDIDFLGGQFRRQYSEGMLDEPAYLAGAGGGQALPASYGITQLLDQLRAQLPPGAITGLLGAQASEQESFRQLMAQREAAMQQPSGIVPKVGQFLGYGNPEAGGMPIFSPWIRDESQIQPWISG